MDTSSNTDEYPITNQLTKYEFANCANVKVKSNTMQHVWHLIACYIFSQNIDVPKILKWGCVCVTF